MDRKRRDRGTKKWTAMMLPEHVAALKDWLDEDQYVEKPEFDDWELQLIQDEVEVAFKRKNVVLIRTWKEGKIKAFQGVIEKINLRTGHILLEDPFGTDRIQVTEIIGVQSMD